MTRKILVIEDEQPVLQNVVEILQLEEYDVRGEADGISGLSTARSFLPDLILCDIVMPAMDGYQVLREVRANPDLAQTPFIFMTALADREAAEKGLKLGADEYVTKPFSIPDFLALIANKLA